MNDLITSSMNKGLIGKFICSPLECYTSQSEVKSNQSYECYNLVSSCADR